MSGFSYHHNYSHDAPSLQNCNSFVKVSHSLQREDTNTVLSQGIIPFHFHSKEVNAIGSFDAISGSKVPKSDLLCVLDKSLGDHDAGMTTHMQKRRRSNSNVVSRIYYENKKIIMEGQHSQGTPEKGYVYVRARRGQATDKHSLAERVRREKIGDRMKILQSLVPGCDKINGKTQVLDEIINYVQSLQTQVQILMCKPSLISTYASGYEANLGGIIAPSPLATTKEGICSLDASLSCMMKSSYNELHFADDSQYNSLSSASSSSLTSQEDLYQKKFISKGTEIPLWETGVQGHISSTDQYWLDLLAQLELGELCTQCLQ